MATVRNKRQKNSKSEEPGLLRDTVYKRLRDDLIAGQHVPGDILVEGMLAETFDVSRSPVREALHRLADEGFVKILPRSGYLVTAVTPGDIAENVHLRKLLEGEAARLAATRMTSSDIEKLKTIQHEEEKPEADSLALNREFHMTIAEIAGSKLMTRIIENLLDQDERILRLHPLIVNPKATRAHWTIIAALEEGAPEAAQEAMREHIEEMALRINSRFEDVGRT